MTALAPRSTRRYPKLAVALIVAALLLIGVAVVQTRASLSTKRAESGMTLGAVRSSSTKSGGALPDRQLDLTVGYTVAGTQRTVNGNVESAAYIAQGKTVWVCFDPADPSRAHLRLPMDDLCA